MKVSRHDLVLQNSQKDNAELSDCKMLITQKQDTENYDLHYL